MPHEIEQLVDELLLEHGSYEPLLLLQHAGNLKYRHYDAWRSGKSSDKHGCLDSVLSGELADILTTLKLAASYAQKLGLESANISYMGWEGAATRSLCLSHDSQMQKYLGTHYKPSQDRFQMDLFMDSPITGVLNAISKALSQRNPDKAKKQLQQLEEMDSGHAQIKTFEVLLEAQKHLYEPVGNISEELERLEQQIAPLAEDALKQEARDFLVPHWWKLSEALQDSVFNPETPKLHCSYTHAFAYDWNGVRTSIEWEDNWHQYSILLIRHVKACTMLRDEPASYLSVFRLCWHHPKQLAEVFNGNTTAGLKQQWQLFQDSNNALEKKDFPAWFLMRHSGLINSLPSQLENEEGNDYRGYQLIYTLLQIRQKNDAKEEMKLRKQLQDINPELLKTFIKLNS